MEHLTTEALARLVDETPSADEAAHLAACESCSRGLAAFRDQTDALAALPEILPPKGDWKILEAQLRSEGLVRDRGLAQKLGLARTPAWMPAAAAVVLFLGGTALGAGLTTRSQARVADSDAAAPASVEDAASAVRLAEQSYVSAVTRYREALGREGADAAMIDPISRYAALEHLVSVSQAAVRQAPGDPFLNGFLASAIAERDATLRVVSAGQDNWF